jgi:hypothetical protein
MIDCKVQSRQSLLRRDKKIPNGMIDLKDNWPHIDSLYFRHDLSSFISK